MIRKSKIVLALTLVLTLGASLLPPVSLADEPIVAKQAAITKVLRVPIGTNPATCNFIFKVFPISINEDTNIKGEMPTIGDGNVVTISFSEAVKKGCECVSLFNCTDDVWHYYLESDHLFPSDGDKAVKWPHAGIYLYEIGETYATDILEGEKAHITGERYKINVYVKAKEEGEGFEIANISAYKIRSYSGLGVTEKVDPSPGDGTDTFSRMRFHNVFYRHNGGNGQDPVTPAKQTLVIEKQVEGDYANRNIYFPFTLTITKHSLIKEQVIHRVYLLDADNNPLKNFANNGSTFYTESGTGYGYATITIDSSTPTKSLAFKLKDGEKLVVTNAYVGTSYRVSEDGTLRFIPSATVTSAGKPAYSGNGVISQSITIPDGTTPPILYVGETDNVKKNKVLVTNEYVVAPDTGLNISDLPFYAMIFLAIAGLVTFVVIKARSRKNT